MTSKFEKLHYRKKFLTKYLLNGFKTKKTILFYPQRPYNCYTIYKICRVLGYTIMNNPKRRFDLAIAWEDTTFRENPFLESLAETTEILNLKCKDTSKEKIDKISKKVFGYSTIINPLKHKGECVKKSNLNGYRKGKIVNCPIKPEKGFVYQKILNNQVNNSLVEDLRVVIFKDKIPLMLKKYRLKSIRFGTTTYKSKISKLKDSFTKNEIKKIILFCKELGMDFGELDILRDRDDGKIYIIDANNTPSGPNSALPEKEKRIALKISSKTFKEVFM